MEEKFKKSCEQYEIFIENQPVGMFRASISKEGRFIFANSAAAHLLGYPTVETLMEASMVDIYQNPSQWALLIEQLVSENRITGLELELRKKESTPTIISMSLQLVRDEEDVPVAVDGTIEDVSDKKHQEKELHTIQTAYDHAPVGIFRISGKGDVLDANQWACESLGYSKDEMLSLKLWDIDPSFTKDTFHQNRKKMGKAGHISLETIHRHKSGQIFPVEIDINYHELEGGKYSG